MEIWRGKSGRGYQYTLKPISVGPPMEMVGNYIFAKTNSNGEWLAVYIGEGELRNRYNDAVRDGCVEQKGATHYHYHENRGQQARKNEERDLIDGHPECMSPTGCNEI